MVKTSSSIGLHKDYRQNQTHPTKKPDFNFATMIDGLVNKNDMCLRHTNERAERIQQLKDKLRVAEVKLSRRISRTRDEWKASATSTFYADIALVDASNTVGTYSGNVSNSSGLPHGYGRMVYSTGNWFEGDWKDGHKHGYGKFQNHRGEVYEGNFDMDQRDGKGTIYFADGRELQGSFNKGKVKQGDMTYVNGSKYSGSFKNGKRHGYGKYYDSDGSCYEGGFYDDHFHGKGKFVWADGIYYEGQWRRGAMHGRGEEGTSDGLVRYSGLWDNGKPLR